MARLAGSVQGVAPNDDAGVAFEPKFGRVFDWESDVDGGAFVVVVLDFGFSEGGLARDGPVDRFLAVDEAFVHELGESAEDSGFVLGKEGAVFAFPICEDAEALELSALFFNDPRKTLCKPHVVPLWRLASFACSTPWRPCAQWGDRGNPNRGRRGRGGRGGFCSAGWRP